MRMVRKILKWAGYALLVLVVVVFGAWVRGGYVSDRLMAKTYTVPAVTISAAAKARATVERGRHLYQSRGMCAECHAEDLGGRLLYDDMIVGQFGGINLTRRVKERTDEQLIRSIRHGVKDDGTANWMPSAAYVKLFTEEDLASLVTYMRAAPAVDREDRPLKWGTVVKVMMGFGERFPVDAEKIDHAAPYPMPVRETRGLEFGRSLVRSICTDCHREDLTGGKLEGAPPNFAPAANITQDALGTWTEDDFVKTLRTGVNPSGAKLREPMGGLTKYIARYTDVELRSMWDYLKTVKGKADF